MSFRISDFKSTMDQFGGPARVNLFEVILSKKNEPYSSLDSRTVSFFCNSVNFPGVAVENGIMSNVAQLPTSFPLRMTPQPISANFLLDSNHNVLSFFHNWLQRVMNFSTKSGTFGGIDTEGDGVGQLPYELGYKDEYACRMTIRHYSTESLGRSGEGAKYYEVNLDNIFPYSIGDTNLDWSLTDQFATLPVTFAYDQIHYSGDRTGNTSVRLKGGLLDTLSDLGKNSLYIKSRDQVVGYKNAIATLQRKISDIQVKQNAIIKEANSQVAERKIRSVKEIPWTIGIYKKDSNGGWEKESDFLRLAPPANL